MCSTRAFKTKTSIEIVLYLNLAYRRQIGPLVILLKASRYRWRRLRFGSRCGHGRHRWWCWSTRDRRGTGGRRRKACPDCPSGPARNRRLGRRSVWRCRGSAPIASIVTMVPFNDSSASSFGIAVISLDLASVATWPSTSRCSQLHALTICCGEVWLAVSNEWRSVLPSTAMMPFAVSGQRRMKGTKATPRNASGSRRRNSGCPSTTLRASRAFDALRSGVSWLGKLKRFLLLGEIRHIDATLAAT